ncbi:hypothetical protein Acr_05g0015950 [Actinidia rufa]|uniref:Uncharacterized protein n=1 Tax=Actinidia rufa TaxID=165716 RepID=A0A7J0EP40_9ERIC|nr:hypothetical protein Acr_05g0015950 [Actinidia rufa]
MDLKNGRHGSGVDNLSAKSLKFWFQPHKKLIGMLTVKTASCDPPFSGELAEGLILLGKSPQRLKSVTVNRNNLPQKGLRKPEKPGESLGKAQRCEPHCAHACAYILVKEDQDHVMIHKYMVALGLVIVPKSHPDLPLPPRKRRTERDQAAKILPIQQFTGDTGTWCVLGEGKIGARWWWRNNDVFYVVDVGTRHDGMRIRSPERASSNKRGCHKGKRQAAGLVRRAEGLESLAKVARAGLALEGWARARLALRRG